MGGAERGRGGGANGVFTKSLRKLQQPFSRWGPERGNPTMTTSTVTAKREVDPQHKVEGENILCSKNRFVENGSILKVIDGRCSYENYSSRFPDGVQKKEIQQ